MSGGRMSCGRLSGGLMSGGLMSAHRLFHDTCCLYVLLGMERSQLFIVEVLRGTGLLVTCIA